MDLIIISFAAFFASLLTLFSGFGLGTLLMPVIAIFLPVSLAITVTALVHLLNNMFKLILLRKTVNWRVTFTFGVPAIITAIIGALLLSYLAMLPTLITYQIFSVTASIQPIKIIVGLLLIIFATVEWCAPKIKIKSKWLPLGGVVSGFFGGLSGHQGAFRSAFLLRAGLSKKQFVSTNASIAMLVDLSRLTVYGSAFYQLIINKTQLVFISMATVAAFLGALLGVIYLHKITFKFIQRIVMVLLYVLALLLIIGVI
jgi:uncharacterized protein